MRRKLVIGNWKMHGSIQQIQELLAGLKAGLQEASSSAEIAVCPTALHISAVAEQLKGSGVKLGAQNINANSSGAFTGETAAPMLVDYGVDFCLTGHSERRELFGESDSDVAAKFKAIQSANMTPVLCIGESLSQREQGITKQVILGQVDSVLKEVGVAGFAHAVIAYEPIWAIGTGETAEPSQAQEVHDMIRQHIAAKDVGIAENLRILYGGSVKSSNAAELFAQTDIDGGLVGGASLNAKEFTSICKSADLK